jgi:hypothetical protein
MGSATNILVDFYTNSSGHPAQDWRQSHFHFFSSFTLVHPPPPSPNVLLPDLKVKVVKSQYIVEYYHKGPKFDKYDFLIFRRTRHLLKTTH